MPNCKYFLVIKAEEKHVRRRARFQQHGDARSHQVLFLFPARQCAEGNSRHSDRNIRGTCTIVCPAKNWVAQFKRGYFPTCDAPRPGRPKTVTTPENIDQIQELILEDRRIPAKSTSILVPLHENCQTFHDFTLPPRRRRRTALFWVATQRVVISYRRFGTTYSHPQGPL